MAMPINVTSTSNNMDTLSRNELIEFVNGCLDLNYTKVENMCTGAAYCQMIHMLWPNKLPIKKIKFDAKLEHAYIDNWKLLQDSFKKLHIEKDVAIQRLVKGRFQDNFEFLQWFYKFFTINDSGDHDYNAKALRGGAGGGAIAARSPAKRAPAPAKKAAPSAAAAASNNVKRSGSNTNSNAEVKRLQGELQEMTLTVEGVEKERDFYFGKLRTIEELCQDKEGDETHADFVALVLEILYQTEDGFGGPGDEVEGEGEVEGEEYEDEQEEY